MSNPSVWDGGKWGNWIRALFCGAFDHIFEDPGDDGEVIGDVHDFCFCCVCDSHGWWGAMWIAGLGVGRFLSWEASREMGKSRGTKFGARIRNCRNLNPIMEYHHRDIVLD